MTHSVDEDEMRSIGKMLRKSEEKSRPRSHLQYRLLQTSSTRNSARYQSASTTRPASAKFSPLSQRPNRLPVLEETRRNSQRKTRCARLLSIRRCFALWHISTTVHAGFVLVQSTRRVSLHRLFYIFAVLDARIREGRELAGGLQGRHVVGRSIRLRFFQRRFRLSHRLVVVGQNSHPHVVHRLSNVDLRSVSRSPFKVSRTLS